MTNFRLFHDVGAVFPAFRGGGKAAMQRRKRQSE
jgi:hypothetical protein